MTYGILLRGRHQSEAALLADRDKHGVIAESALAGGGAGYMSFDNSLYLLLAGVGYERDDSAETRPAVVFAGHIAQQQLHIGLRVVAYTRSIACRPYSRVAVQSLYFETRIVGEAVVAVAGLDIPGLDVGILVERAARLGNILITSYLFQRQDLKAISHYAPDFVELMGIVGCKDYTARSVCHLLNNVNICSLLSYYDVDYLAGYDYHFSDCLAVDPFCGILVSESYLFYVGGSHVGRYLDVVAGLAVE